MSARVPTAAIGAGWPALAARLCACLMVLAIIPPGPASGEPRGEPKRVLVLHPFGSDFLPWSAFARTIRTALEQQSPWPLEVQEHNLLSARFNNPGAETPFVDYLRSLYSGRPPDIVVSIGAPAARFVQKYRAQLFPKTPMVLTAVEQRLVNRTDLTENDTIIAVHNDFLTFFDSILQVLPDTQTIAMVIGASPLEKFWLEEAKREVKPLENRVASRLVRQSLLCGNTEAGVDAPATHRSVLGLDVGRWCGCGSRGRSRPAQPSCGGQRPDLFLPGSLLWPRYRRGPDAFNPETSDKTVNAVIRILGGEKPADIKVQPIGFASPKYDWREMQRWGISESNLPAGSEILFRESEYLGKI